MNEAERRAARWYRLRGWRILGANVWAGGNELDLIVRRGRELRFVEVKEKRGPAYGDPREAVTAEKQRRVRRAAAAWLAAHPELVAPAAGLRRRRGARGRLERLGDASRSAAAASSLSARRSSTTTSLSSSSSAPPMLHGRALELGEQRVERRDRVDVAARSSPAADAASASTRTGRGAASGTRTASATSAEESSARSIRPL